MFDLNEILREQTIHDTFIVTTYQTQTLVKHSDLLISLNSQIPAQPQI